MKRNLEIFAIFFIAIILQPDDFESRPGGGQTYRSSSSSSSKSSSSTNRSSSSSYKSSSSNYNRSYSSSPSKTSPTRPSNSSNNLSESRYTEILSPEKNARKLENYSLNLTLKKDTGLSVKEKLNISSPLPDSKSKSLRHLTPYKWGLVPGSSLIKYLNFRSSENILITENADYAFQGNLYEPSWEYTYEEPKIGKTISFQYDAYKTDIPESSLPNPNNEKLIDGKKISYRWNLLPVNTADYSEFSNGDFEIEMPTDDFSYTIVDKSFDIKHTKENNFIKGKITSKTKEMPKNGKVPEILISVPLSALDESLTPLPVFTTSEFITQRKLKIKYSNDTTATIRDQFTFNIQDPSYFGNFRMVLSHTNPNYDEEKEAGSTYYYDYNLTNNFSKRYINKNTNIFWSYYPELKPAHEIELSYKTLGNVEFVNSIKRIRWAIPSPVDKFQGNVELEIEIPEEWSLDPVESKIWIDKKAQYYTDIKLSKKEILAIPFKISKNILIASIPRIREKSVIVLDLKLNNNSIIENPSKWLTASLILARAHYVYGYTIYFSTFAFFAFGLTFYLILKSKKSRLEIERKKQEIIENNAKAKREELERSFRLQLNDPDFSIANFLSKVRSTGIILTNEWLSGDLGKSRSLVSSGIFNRFRVQQNLLKSEGLVNVMENWDIQPSKIDFVENENSTNVIHVLISGFAKDANLPLSMPISERKKKVSKMAGSGYEEYWSFIRGVNSKTKNGILNDVCPNCGGSAENISQSNKCVNCGTIYNSSEYDWVLSEITQTDEWKRQKKSNIIAGLEDAVKILPFISKQKIEDRASAIFWRWIESNSTGNKNSLIRDATSEYLSAEKFDKKYLSQPAIGLVELTKVVNNDSYIGCEVEIFWSASFRAGEEPKNQKAILNLILTKTSKNIFGIGEHSCSSCGGALPEDDSLKCAYCSSVLPAKNDDWLLMKISST